MIELSCALSVDSTQISVKRLDRRRMMIKLLFIIGFLGMLAQAQQSNSGLLTANFSVEATIAPNGGNQFVDLPLDGTTPGATTIDIWFPDGSLQPTLLTPSGQEVNGPNSEGLGYGWGFLATALDSQAPTTLELPGAHLVITVPDTASPGNYRLRFDSAQLTRSLSLRIFVINRSSLIFGVMGPGKKWFAGSPVEVNGVILQGGNPLSGVNITAKVVRQSAEPQDVIQGYQLQSQRDNGDGNTTYTYTAALRHMGSAARVVSARLTGSSSPNVTVTPRSTLVFLNVGLNQTLRSRNSFELVVPNGLNVPLGTLQWEIESDRVEADLVMGDGGSFDTKAGDGVYTGRFTPQAAGRYIIAMEARGSGSPPSWIRNSSGSIDVIEASGSIASITEILPDANGNALADSLDIVGNFNIQRTGVYEFFVYLEATNGLSLSRRESVSLAAGAQSIRLSIPGKDLAQEFRPGYSFRRTISTLSRMEGFSSDTLEERKNEASAGTWNLQQFDRGDFYLTGSIQASGVVTTGGPPFDFLRVDLGARTPGGNCDWYGAIETEPRSAKPLSSARGQGRLSPGETSLRFDFPAARLQAAAINGPLKVRSIEVTCDGSEARLGESALTPAFRSQQFIALTPLLTTSLTDQTIALVPGQVSGFRFKAIVNETMDLSDSRLRMIGLPAGIRFNSRPGDSWFLIPRRTELADVLGLEDHDVPVVADPGMAAGTYAGTLEFRSGEIVRTYPLTVHIVAAPIRFKVVPESIALTAGQSVSPTLSFSSGGSPIDWSLEPAVGQVTNAGVYTAPAVVNARQVIRVRAKARLDDRVTDTMLVTLLTQNAIVLSRSSVVLHPGQSTCLSATVPNVQDQRVIWSTSQAGVALDQFGPATVCAVSTGTVSSTVTGTLTAPYAANPSLATSIPLTLVPPATLSLSPATVNLAPGQSSQLTIQRTNLIDPSLTWVLDPPLGTMSPEGLYTAPARVEATSVVTATAYSVEDPLTRASTNFVLSAGIANPPPSPWISEFLGAASPAGPVVSFENNGYLLGASGCCWLGVSDTGLVLKRPVSGDAIVTARFRSLGEPIARPDGSAQSVAGIQLRSGAGNQAVYAGVQLERTIPGAMRWGISYRASSAKGSGWPEFKVDAALPDWVKLVRSGTQVMAYQSNDNRNWTPMWRGYPAGLPTDVEAVLFASNGIAALDSFSISTRPDILLSSPGPIQNTVPGRSVSFEIRSIPLLGSNVSLNLSTEELPTGIVAGFSANPIVAGQSTRLTLTVGQVAEGTYPVLVRAEQTGFNKTIRLTLRVYADYSLTIQGPESEFVDTEGFENVVALNAANPLPVPVTLSILFPASWSATGITLSPLSLQNPNAISAIRVQQAGGYPSNAKLTVRGLMPGGNVRTTQLPVLCLPLFAAQLGSDDVPSIRRGSEGVRTLQVRNGLPGSVNWTFGPLPPGLTVQTDTVDYAFNTVNFTFRIRASATATVGSAAITATASQHGVSRTLSFGIIVSP